MDDFEECLSCLADSVAYDRRGRDRLIDLWRALFSGGAGIFSLLIDEDQPKGQRVVRFSFKAFVADEYARRMETGLPPTIGLTLLEHWQNAPNTLLTLPEIRRANLQGGLNMVEISHGTPEKYRNLKIRADIATRTVDWVRYSSAGYRLRSFLMEMYDEFDYQWAEGLGCVLLADYGGLSLPSQSPRLLREARLYGFRIGEHVVRYGTVAQMISHVEQPRFGFTATQQEMLLHAMQGETDDELAADLRLAPVTVKKRWSAVYDRVAAIAPEVLAARHEMAERGVKSLQRRRRLIDYLRGHMEELRPYEPRK